MIDIMPSRYRAIEATINAYRETGISFLAYDGTKYGAAGGSDDVGIYFVVPKLAKALNLSPGQSIDVFFLSLLISAFILGTVGLFLLYPGWLRRSISFVGLALLTLLSWAVGDVYIAYTAAAMAVVPLFLYLTKARKSSTALLLFVALSGLYLGFLGMVRSQSSTAVLIFITLLTFSYLQEPRMKRIIIVALLAVSFLIPKAYMGYSLNRRDAYLVELDSSYSLANRTHPLWHSVYIGFGFLNNPYGIEYDDNVAYRTVESIRPNVPKLSEQYDSILRQEIIGLARKDPKFFLMTIFAKVGVLLGYLFVFANIGLIAALKRPKPLAIELAFWLALAFNSLFAVLVMPSFNYALGFIAVAVLYALVSINEVQLDDWRDLGASIMRRGAKPRIKPISYVKEEAGL